MRYKIIDYIKYICALEVVWLHTVNCVNHTSGVAIMVNKVVIGIFKVLPPVELFFVFSAYFLFSKPVSVERFTIWGKKLFSTYLLYSVLYLPQMTENFSGRNTLLNIMSIVRQLFFTGYSMMGWFVPALLWGALIVSILISIERNIKWGGYCQGVLL